MTFAEYNTDTNFDNDKSSLDELVKIGVDEGKSEDEIRNTLSAKWKNSKKINELSSYYQKHSANRKNAETPKVEEKEEVKETVKEVPQTVIKQKSATANKQNTDLQTQQNLERQTAQNNKASNWDNVIDSAARLGKASKTVDDHYIENLPRGIINAYKNEEFGEPGSPEAKQRLGYFVVEALSSPLKTLANGMSRFAGQGDRFADTESQAEKFNKTNLQNALENRWNKYKQETNNAMDLLKQRGFADETIQEAIDTVSANNRLQTAFNRATEEQKAYALEVMTGIGNYIGNMNDADFVNTIMGMAAMGESLDWKEAAGMLVYRFVKDPEKKMEALSNLGFDGDFISAGIGSGLLGGLGGNGKNKKDGSSGDDLDIGLTMDDADYDKLESKASALSADLYNGKISKDEFVKEYDKLVAEMNKHKIYKWKNNKSILSTKDILNANKELELKDKFGEDTKSKTYKNGKKAVDYFSDKMNLFNYFKGTEDPNYIDAKAATKNKDYKMKEYQEALKQYEILKKANAVGIVGKY